MTGLLSILSTCLLQGPYTCVYLGEETKTPKATAAVRCPTTTHTLVAGHMSIDEALCIEFRTKDSKEWDET